MARLVQIALLCSSILGALVNALMVAVFAASKTLQTPHMYMMANAILADSLFAVSLFATCLARIILEASSSSALPPPGAPRLTPSTLPSAQLGEFVLCQVQGFTLNVCLLVSILSSALIALNHYFQLRPDSLNMTRLQIYSSITAVWVVSALLATAPEWTVEHADPYTLDSAGAFCFVDFRSTKSWLVGANIAHMVISLCAPWIAFATYCAMAGQLPMFLYEERVKGVDGIGTNEYDSDTDDEDGYMSDGTDDDQDAGDDEDEDDEFDEFYQIGPVHDVESPRRKSRVAGMDPPPPPVPVPPMPQLSAIRKTPDGTAEDVRIHIKPPSVTDDPSATKLASQLPLPPPTADEDIQVCPLMQPVTARDIASINAASKPGAETDADAIETRAVPVASTDEPTTTTPREPSTSRRMSIAIVNIAKRVSITLQRKSYSSACDPPTSSPSVPMTDAELAASAKQAQALKLAAAAAAAADRKRKLKAAARRRKAKKSVSSVSSRLTKSRMRSVFLRRGAATLFQWLVFWSPFVVSHLLDLFSTLPATADDDGSGGSGGSGSGGSGGHEGSGSALALQQADPWVSAVGAVLVALSCASQPLMHFILDGRVRKALVAFSVLNQRYMRSKLGEVWTSISDITRSESTLNAGSMGSMAGLNRSVGGSLASVGPGGGGGGGGGSSSTGVHRSTSFSQTVTTNTFHANKAISGPGSAGGVGARRNKS